MNEEFFYSDKNTFQKIINPNLSGRMFWREDENEIIIKTTSKSQKSY